jgi:alkylhydroperoxidase family enzyme
MGSHIEMIDEHEAEGKLKVLYDGYGKKVANILKVQSLFPDSLEAHYSYYKTIMFKKSPLSRAYREMIATVVSAENECFY